MIKILSLDPVRTRTLLTIACFLIASVIAWAYLDFREKEILHQGETIRVVVAKHHIPALTRLTASELAWKKIPRAWVPHGAVKNPENVLNAQTIVPFNTHEPFLYNKLTDTGLGISDAIPEGLRAFTIAVNEETGLAGLLRPGDRVDILHLHRRKKKVSPETLIQAVKVLAVGTRTSASNEENNHASSVTLALTPSGCARALAAQASGRLHLSLRPSGERKIRSAPETAADSFKIKKR